MDVLERAIFLAIGGGIGFILGYIVARLREIKEEVDEVLDIEKHNARTRDERGFMRFPVVADIMLLTVVVLVAYAAFASQKASNAVEDQQDDITRITACNQEFLSKTIEALNERTTYTQAQAEANVDLQKAQNELLAVLLEEPPPSDARSEAAFRTYFDVLTEFVDVNTKTADKVEEFPYPTNEELTSCLESK